MYGALLKTRSGTSGLALAAGMGDISGERRRGSTEELTEKAQKEEHNVAQTIDKT